MYARCCGAQSIACIVDIDSSSLSGSCQPVDNAVISGTERSYVFFACSVTLNMLRTDTLQHLIHCISLV